MYNKEKDSTNAEMLRMKAEEQNLLHELQVHQIELQMQNEELQQAYETSEIALKKYTMLYDCSPLSYYTLNSAGSILELNFTGADLLHEKRFSLLNANFKLFVSDDSKLVFNSFLKRIFSTLDKESCEVKLIYDNKQFCMVYIEGIIIEDEQKCLLSVVDISKFK